MASDHIDRMLIILKFLRDLAKSKMMAAAKVKATKVTKKLPSNHRGFQNLPASGSDASHAGADDMADVDANYSPSYKAKEQALLVILRSCNTCGPEKECLVDKNGNHQEVTWIMRRLWVSALVRFHHFFILYIDSVAVAET